MSVGSIITAARYNEMQAKVIATLGNGGGNLGYGQRPTSRSVPIGSEVDYLDMRKLEDDLKQALRHQTNNSTHLPLTRINSNDEITNAVYNEYETASTFIYNPVNRFTLHPLQASTESRLSNQRTLPWGGNSQPQTIKFEFDVTFPGGYSIVNSNGTDGIATGLDHRRHFFNSGGEIRFAFNLVNPETGGKVGDWKVLLSSIGEAKFNHTTLTANSGVSAGLGNFDLTGTFQTLYTKSGTSVYTDNTVVIKARGIQTSNVIRFSVELTDDLSNNIDEVVDGTLAITVSQYRATNAVVVPSPTYQTVTNLQ